MSSGIPIDIDVCEAPINGRLDDTTLIENLNRLELEFSPGEHFAYSNCAYDVAGAVAAKVSGMPFDRFVNEHIFKPLGMTSSYMLGNRDDEDFAEGYSPEGKSWKPAPLTAADRLFASGNLASNQATCSDGIGHCSTRPCCPGSRCRKCLPCRRSRRAP
jgi:CubicO group peptidase (beta-lactamase class C family)